MKTSFLIGAVAGMRAMTPLATVAVAARRGELPADNGAPRLLGSPLVVAGALALAAGELAGDKLPSAPDRIVAPGMAARIVTGAIAAAALAPREKRVAAAGIGVVAAIGSAYLTWKVRTRFMQQFGQGPTGFVEDAIALGSAALIARRAEPA